MIPQGVTPRKVARRVEGCDIAKFGGDGESGDLLNASQSLEWLDDGAQAPGGKELDRDGILVDIESDEEGGILGHG
jgi:hypothetical protein